VKKLLIIALALVAALGVVSSASAKSRDRNHDRLPDRWERAHHLSLKVKQAKRDQDRDGLNNRGEFRAKTNPRDSDTDDDGVNDGNEQAGTIKSFEGGVLTITLAQGGELSAKVDDQTEIECHGPGDLQTRARTSSDGSDDGPGHDAGDDNGDDGPNHDAGDDHGDDGPNDQAGDDNGDDDDFDTGDNEGEDGDDVNEQGDDDNDSCGQEALTAGTKVHEAELEATSAGTRWEELELLTTS
jgi:hypothetical protein